MSINQREIKVFILILYIVGIAAFFVFDDRAIRVTDASSGGADPASSGAPGEVTCTACHTAIPNTGQFQITAPSTYTPGGPTVQISVTHTTTDTTRRRWGFQLTALNATNLIAGNLVVTNATNTAVDSFGGRQYMNQTDAGTFAGTTGGATWTFNWTPPLTNVGAVTFYSAGLQANNGNGSNQDQTYTARAVTQPVTPVVIRHGFSDFDGDGKADASVFRPSTGIWYLNQSTLGFKAMQLGIATDKLAPADFDGDDKADIAVWRPDAATVAAFYILQSSTNTLRIELFGQTGDDSTAVGDWDGDGKADPAVYRDSAVGSQSYFYYRGSLSNPGGNITYRPWGSTGDKAMRGDFDGDGKLDAAVFRPSNGVWYISQSSNGTVRYENWGLSTDKFVPADYDGDAKTDLAVFRNGIWYVKQSSNSLAAYHNWGLSTDTLVPADYDGDAKTDPAVYRNGTWWVRLSSSGNLSVQSFGLGTDVAVPGAFVK